jgi:hypothetical protein
MGNALIFRALLVSIALIALTDVAQAQCSGQPGANTFCAGPPSGGTGLPSWRALVGADLPAPLTAPIQVNSTVITGGTSGRTPYNNAGVYGEYAMGGDCTLAVPSITCTKTGGAPFATSATTDATNANNIGSGTLNNARLNMAAAADFRAGTAGKILPADQVFTAEVAVTYGATTTFDFSTFINASVTLTGNITTISFTNVKAGQAGLIRFIQSGAGSFTVPSTINTNLKCPGGCNVVLTTGSATAVDILAYQCISTTYCIGGALLKDVK